MGTTVSTTLKQTTRTLRVTAGEGNESNLRQGSIYHSLWYKLVKIRQTDASHQNNQLKYQNMDSLSLVFTIVSSVVEYSRQLLYSYVLGMYLAL